MVSINRALLEVNPADPGDINLLAPDHLEMTNIYMSGTASFIIPYRYLVYIGIP